MGSPAYVFLLAPEFAVQSIGAVVAILGLVWSGKKLLDTGMENTWDIKRKKQKLLVYMIFMVVMVFLATHHSVLLVSGSMLIGILFLAAAVYLMKRVLREERCRIKKYGMFLIAVLLFFTGCVSMATPEEASVQKMLTIGSFLILYGFGSTLFQIYKSGEKEYV